MSNKLFPIFFKKTLQNKIMPLYLHSQFQKRELQFKCRLDSVAQLVEHYTFNVGVLGSNPSGITNDYKKSLQINCRLFFYLLFLIQQTLPFFSPVDFIRNKAQFPSHLAGYRTIFFCPADQIRNNRFHRTIRQILCYIISSCR